MIRVLRAADRVAVPWKNGGGVTREVAVSPECAGMEDFDWRASIADVSTAGPFSRFDGINRTMMILKGRLSLKFDDRDIELNPESSPLAFSGDAACRAAPIGGAVTDLNVMARRGRCSARVERLVGATTLLAPTTLLVAIVPATVTVDDEPINLDVHDAVLSRTNAKAQIAGAVWAIRIV